MWVLATSSKDFSQVIWLAFRILMKLKHLIFPFLENCQKQLNKVISAIGSDVSIPLQTCEWKHCKFIWSMVRSRSLNLCNCWNNEWYCQYFYEMKVINFFDIYFPLVNFFIKYGTETWSLAKAGQSLEADKCQKQLIDNLTISAPAGAFN